MIDAITRSVIPLRIGSLAVLLRQRAIDAAMEAYAHDIQWSILCSLHSMFGQTCRVPSYSSMANRLRHRHDASDDKADVETYINQMMDTFLPERRPQDETV